MGISVDPQGPQDTLGDLMRSVWQARLYVFVGVLAGLVCAYLFMAFAVPHSKASLVLAPANPMQMTSVEEQGTRQATKPPSDISLVKFEATFKGIGVAGLLLRDPEITNGLSRDVSFSFSDPERDWTVEKLSEYIAERVVVNPVGESDLIALEYFHPDKAFATTFLNRLHMVSDGLIRHGLRKDVSERIAYITTAMAEVNNPDHRRAMTDLLMEQERLKMLVSIDQPYAAAIVVPAASSVKALWPDPLLVYSAFILVGAFLGFVVFEIRVTRRDEILDALSRGADVQEWFFPESGNNNEKPEGARPRKKAGPKKDKRHKPLTGKKNKAKKQSASKGVEQGPNITSSDAAE